MNTLQKTVFYDYHVGLGAQMVDFGGWDMPIQYKAGIIQEHLATRKRAGLFDVSHMGRFIFRGKNALPFLQHVLTNNAAALKPGRSQYTLIANEQGGVIDDTYLYYCTEGEYMLVVNAANRPKDWTYFQEALSAFDNVELEDRSEEIAMLSLQGPCSEDILQKLTEAGTLPEAQRNAVSRVTIASTDTIVARTGYTGEPVCFELFFPSEAAGTFWELLREYGAEPNGLGARDTLRLEAGLPLYGHEFGTDRDGREILMLVAVSAKFGLSFAAEKGDFIGKAALQKQFDALEMFKQKNYTHLSDLPRRIRLLTLTGKGIARAGSSVFFEEKEIGYITSGTMVPYWRGTGEGDKFTFTEETGKRAIGLALLDSDIPMRATVDVDIRGRRTPAHLVPRHVIPESSGMLRAIVS